MHDDQLRGLQLFTLQNDRLSKVITLEVIKTISDTVTELRNGFDLLGQQQLLCTLEVHAELEQAVRRHFHDVDLDDFDQG